MKKLNRSFVVAAMAAFLMAAGMSVTARASSAPQGSSALSDKVRHELNMMTNISVFDYLTYEVTGDTVRLSGEVTRPWLKTEAAKMVQRISGVTQVVNDIEVLPLSRMDDHIRLRAYRTLFHRDSSLQRYRIGANAPIRIIVRNGHLSLEGFVGSEFDRNLAGILARQVPSTFTITNNLKIG